MRNSKVFFLLTLLLTMAVVTGCGKKSDPVPDQSRLLFSWRNVFATMTDNGCISLSGSVAGASQNMGSVVLEVQPLDASCEGCPFVPQETHSVNASDAWESPSGESFRFAYCPSTRADSYRWRLAGKNVFSGLPPVLTPVRVVQAMQTTEIDMTPESVEDAMEVTP